MANAGAGGGGARPITVEELVALNAEIAALVRAGSPLEAGLTRSAEELPGTLGIVAGNLSGRMKRGESLVEALEAEKASIPPLYRAVVEAGARTGDVSAALEGLTRYLRGFSEAREAVGLALWYPLVVATIAYVLFLGIVVVVVPRFVAAFESFRLPGTWVLSLLDELGRTAWLWWPAWPIILAMVAWAWMRSGRASRFDAGTWTFLSLFPWMRSLVRDYQSAGFAELLALLLENRIAYPQAVTLAAEASGNDAVIAEARSIADELKLGRTTEQAVAAVKPRAFSPMLRWVLAHGKAEGSVVRALRNLAPMYRTRATLKAEKLRAFLPAFVILAVGGSATLLYVLTLFLPLTAMLDELAGP